MSTAVAKSKGDCAVALARRGFHVFPIAAGKKAPPRFKDWQQWATRDKHKIQSHWRDNPEDNIGIFTGRFASNGHACLVADIDNKPGKNGNASVKKLTAEGCTLPPTLTVLTPTGGWHKVYVTEHPVKQGVNVLADSVDIRSAGGYIVGPGSTIDGRAYEITDDREPAPAPAWIVDKCGTPRVRTEAAQEPIKGVDPDAAAARAIHYLENEAPTHDDPDAYKVACRVKDFGVDVDTAIHLMQEYWDPRCEPPRSDNTVDPARNAYKYGLEPLGIAAPEGVFSKVEPEPAPFADPPAKTTKLALFDTNASRLGDVFTKAPPKPKFIVQDFYPVAPGQESAIGGAGKTTRKLWEKIHIILGRPLYGCPVLQPGPVLIVTKEDTADIFRYRMHCVAQAMDLSPADLKRIADNLHILDLTGDVDARLVAVNRDNLYATDLAERIYRSYRAEGLAQVSFDPWNGFSPGERYVNDAEAALMVAGALISRELQCNVCYVGHVSKHVGRQKIIDAHSGRGGSAMGDNARFVLNYVEHDVREDAKAWPAPASAERAATQRNLFRLHVTKQSYAKRRSEPVWIERQGYGFTVHEGAPESPTARLEADGERLKLFVQQELERGAKHTQRTLDEQHDRYGMGRNEARKVIAHLQAAGGLVERELPAAERAGRRTHFLEPVFTPAPELDGADPFQ